MSEARFASQVVARGLVPREELEEARRIRSQMIQSGLDVPLDEILVRRGSVSEAARREVRKQVGLPAAPPARAPLSPAAEDELAREVVRQGFLTDAQVAQVREFAAWAAGQGVGLGLAEILEGNGLVDREALARIDPPPRRSRTTSAHRARGPAASGRRPRAAAAPGGPSRLVLGLAIGGGAVVLLLAGLLAALGGEDPPPVQPTPPPVAREIPEPSDPVDPPERRADELEELCRELETRVDRDLARGELEGARRGIARFEERLASPGARERYAARVQALRRRVDAAFASRQPPPEPDVARRPDPEPAPPRPVEGLPSDVRTLGALYQRASDELRWLDALQYIRRLTEIQRQAENEMTLGQVHLELRNPWAALEALDRAEALCREGKFFEKQTLGGILNTRASARWEVLDFDGALADLQRYLELGDDPAHAHYLLGNHHWIRGDFESARAEYQAALRFGEHDWCRILLGLVALGEGDRDEALRCFQETAARTNSPDTRRVCRVLPALAWVFPSRDDVDLARARAILASDGPVVSAAVPLYFYTRAVILHAGGDYRKSYEYFADLGPGWVLQPFLGYYYAQAAFALGYEEEGRRVLRTVVRLRPALASRFGFGAQGEALVSQARKEGEEIAARPVEERQKVVEARETRVLHLGQIEALERTYRFAEAARDYEVYAGRVPSESIRVDATARARRASSLAGVLSRLAEAAGNGTFESVPVVLGAVRGEVRSATTAELTLRIGRGEATIPWSAIGVETFLALARRLTLSSEEWFALGSFLLDGGLEDDGWSALARAARSKALRGPIDEFVALRRGIAVPEGGFLVREGRFVTPEEKKRLDAGFVRFRGEWVTPADREHLLEGHQKIAGRWVESTEAELRAKGWEKVGEEWLSPEELAHRRGLWENAQERVTPHFVLRSNRGSAFLDELALLLEGAWPEYVRFFGGEPPAGRRLVVLAFKDFEDYRAYCQKVGSHESIAALGFAPSEEYTAAAYDKFGDVRLFLQTLVHEVAHLFFWTSFGRNVPSWVAEGMASYFEGFRKANDRYEFGHPSEKRLPTLRDALAREGLALEALSTARAAELINRDANQALDFYARCWGIFYFLTRSIDPAHHRILADLMDAARAGRPFDLRERIGEEAGDFERALTEFFENL